jgi:hypothetical protein
MLCTSMFRCRTRLSYEVSGKKDGKPGKCAEVPLKNDSIKAEPSQLSSSTVNHAFY